MESGNDLVQQYFCLISKYDDSSGGRLLHPCTQGKNERKSTCQDAVMHLVEKKKVQ